MQSRHIILYWQLIKILKVELRQLNKKNMRLDIFFYKFISFGILTKQKKNKLESSLKSFSLVRCKIVSIIIEHKFISSLNLKLKSQ